MNKSTSNSKEKEILSKSRKKMLFTVYNSREKSMNKRTMGYDVPYRFHSSVTIDLLNHSPPINHYSKDESKKKDNTYDKIKIGNVRPAAFHNLANL